MRSAIDEFVTTKQENPFATLRQIENEKSRVQLVTTYHPVLKNLNNIHTLNNLPIVTLIKEWLTFSRVHQRLHFLKTPKELIGYGSESEIIQPTA